MGVCGQGAHRWWSGHRHNLCALVPVPAALVLYQTPIRLTSSALPSEQIFAASFSGLLSRREGKGHRAHCTAGRSYGPAVPSPVLWYRSPLWGAGSHAVTSTFSLLCLKFNCGVIIPIHFFITVLAQGISVCSLCAVAAYNSVKGPPETLWAEVSRWVSWQNPSPFLPAPCWPSDPILGTATPDPSFSTSPGNLQGSS